MSELVSAKITEMDLEGRGIAYINGKKVVIPGALSNENVLIRLLPTRKGSYKGETIEIKQPNKHRVIPRCPNYVTCGGCTLQHLDSHSQIQLKHEFLLNSLANISKVTPEAILEPVVGPDWQYRYRARLSVFYDTKSDSMLIGFKKQSSTHITQMNECSILPEHISELIPKLKLLIRSLSAYNRIPQIEIAVGAKLSVLVIRTLVALTNEDQKQIKLFIDNMNNASLQIWLQPNGPDSCYPLYPISMPGLSYELTDFSLEMPYIPTEFTQVNPILNQKMVKLAINLLELGNKDRVADFFCGIGNFTLPIARDAQYVLGIEGSTRLVARARQNAKFNNLYHKVSYQAHNLFTIDQDWLDSLGDFDKWLIDPPREGALSLIKAISKQNAPKRIVYVSCNPLTLARDAAILTNVKGYKLKQAGIINMFPHTAHTESIAVFDLIRGN